MSFDSQLARSVQSDYRRDAAIEREYGSRISVTGVLLRGAVALVALAVVAELLLTAAAS